MNTLLILRPDGSSLPEDKGTVSLSRILLMPSWSCCHGRVERLSGATATNKDTLLKEQFVENLRDPTLHAP